MATNPLSFISLLVELIDCSLMLLLLSSFLKLKKQNHARWVLFTLIHFATNAGIKYIISPSRLIQYAIFSLSLILLCFLFCESPSKASIVAIISCLLFIGLEFLYRSTISSQFYALPPDISAQPTPIRVFNDLMSRSLLVTMVFIIRNRKVFFSYSFTQFALLILYFLLSFSSYIVIADLFATLSPVDDLIWICAALLFIGNGICISLFFSIKKRDERIREDVLAIQQLENDHIRYTDMNNHLEELEAWKHDMKKHLQALFDIRKSSNPDKEDLFYSYLSEIQKGLDQSLAFINTKNPLFDSITSSYCLQAVNSGISVQLEMVVPILSFIDAVDLVSVLGNLWENAIEGCIRANENGLCNTSILFRTFVNANHFIVEQSNSCIFSQDTDLHSTKPDYGHGTGINVIKKVVEKYHGIYGYRISNNTFITRVAFPVDSSSFDGLDSCVVFNWNSDK